MTAFKKCGFYFAPGMVAILKVHNFVKFNFEHQIGCV
jgi:hypothetical protein